MGPDLRGEGSMPFRFKISQTLDGEIMTSMVASSPRILR